MSVRDFDGTDDSIIMSGFANRTGPISYAGLVKRGGTTNFQGIIFGYTSGNVAQNGLMILSGGSGNHVAFGATSSSSELNTISLVPADGWAIIVATHPGGTGTARLHRKLLSGGSWSQGEGTSSITIASTGAGGTLQIGRAAAADFFYDGLLATTAVWDKELSDGEVQSLSTTLSTLAWSGVASGNLIALHDFNQASTGTAVEDLVGAHDQSSITGTTVVNGDDPPGWTFGLGSPPAPEDAVNNYGANTYGTGTYGDRGSVTLPQRGIMTRPYAPIRATTR